MTRLRALPRLFIDGADCSSPVEIPKPEFEKLHNVLRLRSGARIGILPNDGSFWECELGRQTAFPIARHWPGTEPTSKIAVAQGLPKGDKLDEVIRSCSEVGVSTFLLFPADRSVVKWDEKRLEDRLRRFRVIAKEAAETSFRMRIPTVEYVARLDLLLLQPGIQALSELETETRPLNRQLTETTLLVGPEGGWSPREVELIQPFAVTLGPRVLRTEHAALVAASALLTP